MEEEEKRLYILVVDDDPAILAFFSRLFSKQSHISVALSPEEALRMLHHQNYNLIFLDVKLPGIDGTELMKDVKKLNPDAIVIMMSGYNVEKEIKQAMAAGAQDFLPKPFKDIDQIMTIKDVAEYLSLHQFTVYRLAQQGAIPFFKTGKQWRIKRDVLEKWVEQEAERIGKK